MTDIPFFLLLSLAGGIAPAAYLHVDRRHWLFAGLGGMLGYGSAVLLSGGQASPGLMPVFIGAVIVGLYSEAMARLRRTPAILFCIPGIFPLVPGIDAYKTMQRMVEGDVSGAASSGVRTLTLAFAIAFGLMAVTSVFRMRKGTTERGGSGKR